ncbi:MAG: hypothetical protein K2H65_05085, partial [Bacteroidales bacterium]|nr:hypothetical protein [Bacteroidales bacterium]
MTLSSGDGSDLGVFCHYSTYNNKAKIRVSDGHGNMRTPYEAVGVGEQAQYAWLVTPVIYLTNLEEGEPLTVRFKATSASSNLGVVWEKGSVGSKYSSTSLQVLVSNTGSFSKSNVIGTVNIGNETINGTEYEFDLTSPLTGSVQVAFYYANPNYINPNNQTAIENNDDYMTFEIFDVRLEYKNQVAICPPLEGLERTFLTPHSATFTWAPSDSAKYYDFAYGPADEEEYANVVKLTDAEYTMTELDDEREYKVMVTGYCDEEGENAAPDPLTATFTTPEACHVPTGFKVQDVTYYGATFISKQDQGILDEREVRVVSTDNLLTKYFKQPKDTLVQKSGLYDNTSYSAVTRAICRYGAGSVDTSAWSNAVTFTTPVDPANLPDTFDVKVAIAPAGAGLVTGAKKYVEGETITLTATANAGYIFKGWVLDDDTVSRTATYTRMAKLEDEEEETNVKTHLLDFKAVFRKVHIITVNTQPTGTTGGTVTGAGTYDDGVEVTLTATPKSTYIFQEWQNAEGAQVSTNETYKFTPTASASFTAVFRLK